MRELPGVVLGHLTDGQRRRIDALDAAYTDLIAQERLDLARVEDLADKVYALAIEIEEGRS